MVSTQSSYTRRTSPPKYRQQTLEIFDVYRNHGRPEYNPNLPPRPLSALDRKWVHRSVGDLTTDSELINTHPRLQTDFYEELYRKYPQAFTKRRNAREAGRRLFNSRPHVRFEDEERVIEQRSRSAIDLFKHDNHMTNWDREVGQYIRKNSRECFTSVEPSECSGSVLSLKQRLHLNSVTLNKLLNQKSPLRKKFEKDRMTYDSGTENEQSLEDYFLDKSRQRSRNRVKHQRVLQRRINNTNEVTNNENERNSTHKRWLSKSVSPVGRHMYSLPGQTFDKQNGTNDLNVNEVMRDSDLKIDTLLDKLGSRISGPESPPDSAIDMDTPSVQSLVSNDRAMTSDNIYHVNIDLSDNDKTDLYNHSRLVDIQNVQESEQSISNELRAIVENSAISTSHSIYHESEITVSELPDDVGGEHLEQIDRLSPEVSTGPGLLQLYKAELMPELSKLDNQLHSKHEIDQTVQELSNPPSEQKDIIEENGRSYDDGLPKLTASFEHEANSSLDPNRNGNSNEGCVNKQADQDSKDISVPTRPPRGRYKKRELTTTSSLHAGQINVPERSEVDTCILDEVHLEGMSHDLVGRHSSDNTDDTDVRLGIPKATRNEAKIAEKYRRTRSPSPFVVKYRNLSADRPKSAPLLGAETLEIKVVDIPLTDSNNHINTMHSNTQVVDKQPVNKTCQREDILKAHTNDISNGKASSEIFDRDIDDTDENLQDQGFVYKRVNVQNGESKILVSSSQIKQRNSNIMPKEKDDIPNSENIPVGDVKTEVSNNHPNKIHKDYQDNVSETHEPSWYLNGQNESNDRDLRVQTFTSKRGVYKPSASSPRTKDTKTKLKSLLKSKKGSFSPAPINTPTQNKRASIEDLSQQNCMPVYNDKVQYINGVSDNESDRIHEYGNSERITLRDSPASSDVATFDSDDNEDSDDGENCSRTEHRADIHVLPKSEAVICDNIDESDTESDQQTVKTKPFIDHQHETKNSDNKVKTPPGSNGNSASSQESLPRTTNIPPAKPARTRHKKLPTDLNLSQYKIMPNGNEVQRNQPETLQNGVNQDQQSSTGSLVQDEGISRSNPAKSNHKSNDEIESTEPQTSNLAQSKALSASKGSLLGGFKSKTKGKLKSLRKAMSLEKGMDKAGVVTFPDPNNPDGLGSNSSGFPKMKKAPSLKSITSLFERKKKKKGKMNSEETESSSAYGSCQSISSAHTGSSDGHQPVIMYPKPGTSTSKPSGKLQKINPDGTQLIQLVKPQSGPIGFFIAKGSPKYKNGIFISRFADSQPEKTFGGLLSVGDEILEVNGHFVRDLSQDDVYNIISASPIIVMKIFPFIARKDV